MNGALLGLCSAVCFIACAFGTVSAGLCDTEHKYTVGCRLIADNAKKIPVIHPVTQLPVGQRSRFAIVIAQAVVGGADTSEPSDGALDQSGASQPPAATSIHPLLKKAWAYWQDIDNRKRDVAIALFAKYVAQEPDSVLLPEIYAHMGSLFAGAENKKLGERTDASQAIKYFRLSHEAYNGKYGSYHAYAWASLAGISRDVSEERKYYEWLCKIRDSGTVDDIYGFQTIDSVMKGYPVVWDKSYREAFLKWHRTRSLVGEIDCAESNAVWMASNAELSELVRDYPGTAMAAKAAAALGKRTQKINDALKTAMAPDLEVPIDLEATAEEEEPAPTPVRVQSTPAQLPVVQEASRSPYLWPTVALCAILALGAGLLLSKRVRRLTQRGPAGRAKNRKDA